MLFNSGDEVRDRITGCTGIVIGHTDWYNGCVRYGIQPQELKDGIPVKSEWIDEPQLELVEAGKVPPNKSQKAEEPTGGPCDVPGSRRNDPGRNDE